MVRRDSIVARNRNQLKTRIPMESPIFHANFVFGCHQIRGNASGPTEQTMKIMKGVRKYQGSFSSLTSGWAEAARNSPQCLHFIASSWIDSAQKGHFFHYSLSS